MANRKKCAVKKAVKETAAVVKKADKEAAAETKAEKSPERIVRFKLEDAPEKKVFIAGTFNNWQLDTPMNDSKNDGVYTIQLRLAPGEYQYKFVIDGEWRLDSKNKQFVPNGFGELNSVLTVEEIDNK